MKKLFCLMIIFLIILNGCSSANHAGNGAIGQKKLQVVTTFYPMYFFAKQVAGNSANVSLLIPNGVEPHDWEPTAKDMAAIQNADVFVYDSQYMETWANKVLQSIDTSNLKVVEAAKTIKLIDTVDPNVQNNVSRATKDPHVWLSPILAKQEVDNIAQAFEQRDPKNKIQYEKNKANLEEKLSELDHLYKSAIAKATKKEFVTQHAAFGYLAKQYGLTQIPIAGLSPDVEPTLGKLTELAKLTKEKNINIIYFEGMTSSKVAQTLANEIHAKTEVLNPLEGLTKKDQTQGLDYIGVMNKNLNALKETLYQKN